MAESRWGETPEEAEALAECSAIMYHHDGVHEIVRLDALPKELQERADADDAADRRYLKREALRKSAPRGVKVSKSVWRKVLGAQAKGPR